MILGSCCSESTLCLRIAFDILQDIMEKVAIAELTLDRKTEDFLDRQARAYTYADYILEYPSQLGLSVLAADMHKAFKAFKAQWLLWHLFRLKIPARSLLGPGFRSAFVYTPGCQQSTCHARRSGGKVC